MSMRERQYAAPLCDAFLELSRRPCYRLDQRPENIYRCLHRGIPERTVDMSYDDLIWITEIMSDIIDAKSRFTWRHSKGLAEKAGTMAGFYEYDSVQHTKLVIAANLHDLGKLLIPNRILEANPIVYLIEPCVCLRMLVRRPWPISLPKKVVCHPLNVGKKWRPPIYVTGLSIACSDTGGSHHLRR